MIINSLLPGSGLLNPTQAVRVRWDSWGQNAESLTHGKGFAFSVSQDGGQRWPRATGQRESFKK